MDDKDRELVVVTQAGLPLTAEPYRVLAEQLGLGETDVIARLIGGVPRLA